MTRPMSFQDIWKYSKDIQSEVNEEEAKELYDIAMTLKPDSCIVEIGSYLGRSATVLGQASKITKSKLYCIDPFVESPKKVFIANMNDADIEYKLFDVTSMQASKLWNESYPGIGLLFIDGCHSYEAVTDDCQLWLPHLGQGGYVAFHDYRSTWDGVDVKRVVDDCMGKEFELVSDVWSMRVFRKLP